MYHLLSSARRRPPPETRMMTQDRWNPRWKLTRTQWKLRTQNTQNLVPQLTDVFLTLLMKIYTNCEQLVATRPGAMHATPTYKVAPSHNRMNGAQGFN